MNTNQVRRIFGIAALAFTFSIGGCTNSAVEVSNSNADNNNQSVSDSGAMADDANSTTNIKVENTAKTEDSTYAAEKKVIDVKGDFSHIKPEHAAILKKWLAEKKVWESAVKSDAEAENPGSETHPFYVAKDFNKDGKEDFIAGLVKTNDRKKHAFIIFNAPFNAESPAFFTDRTESYDIVSYSDEYGIFIGPAQSDNGYMLKPEGNKYVVKMAEEMMP